MYQWVVYLHILGALVFFMAHGASAVMAFRLRHERDRARICAILDLSSAARPAMYVSLLVLLLAGITAGIMGGWFLRGWIWASIVLMAVLFVGTMIYAIRFYVPIRKAVGLPYRDGGEDVPVGTAASDDEIAALIQRTNPMLLTGFSMPIIAVILWLMVFKPF
jgi:hypothetical protein